MASPGPPLVVAAPAVSPHRFGLLSAATLVADADPHWQNGVEYLTAACAQASVWVDDCDAPVDKPTATTAPSLALGTPFTVVARWDCGVFGQSLGEHAALARQALICSEQRAVEAAYYSGALGNVPTLVDPDCIALNTTGTAVSLHGGVGMLEEHLGLNYCGEGIIHAPRATGALAARFHQTFGTGSQLRTAMGNIWSFGAGYGNTSPAGVAAPSGVVWLYATGVVVIRRSEIFLTPPDLRQAVDRMTNQVGLLAERTYVITTDPCACAAVAICTT